MVKYKKCPRCELNYIEEDKDYCDVCLAEMQGSRLKFADLDEDEEDEKTELCPVCGENYMRPGEKMCDECKKNVSEYEEDDDIDPDQDEEWRNYLDEDTDDLVLEGESIDIGDDFEDDYVEESSEEEPLDDVDYDAGEEFGDLGDEDDEDDEDEDDDF